jgi:hypothetical protein
MKNPTGIFANEEDAIVGGVVRWLYSNKGRLVTTTLRAEYEVVARKAEEHAYRDGLDREYVHDALAMMRLPNA